MLKRNEVCRYLIYSSYNITVHYDKYDYHI